AALPSDRNPAADGCARQLRAALPRHGDLVEHRADRAYLRDQGRVMSRPTTRADRDRARRSGRSGGPPEVKLRWYRAEEGAVHKAVFDYVSSVERQQFDVFNRFVQLEALYDPNTPHSPSPLETSDAIGLVVENVVASNVDTVTAAIAATDVRPRFMTDDG